MKKFIRSLSSSALVLGLIFGGNANGAFARSSEVSSKERELARNIQKHELEKGNLNNKIKKLEEKIAENEEKIKDLESKINSKLKNKLERLTQKEILLNYQYDNCSWWESFSVKKRIRKNEVKKLEVKSEIKEAKEKLEDLKQKRVKLDEDYAVLLQNQEIQYASSSL